MTDFLPLLLRLLPYVACAAVGAWGMHRLEAARLTHAQAQTAQARQQLADERAAAQARATDAIQQHQRDMAAVIAHNATVIEGLHRENATLADSRDLARRLLNRAQAIARGGAVPESAGEPGTDAGAQPDGLATVTDACAAVADEDWRNATALKALQDEVRPQQ
ncbi:MAG: hypothetical protein JSR67_03575 [Proteobacteria bacterium]|nr:hypothetical protein [Pseudomonadota bacterium]